MNDILLGFCIPNEIDLEDTIAFKCYRNLKVQYPYRERNGATIGTNRNRIITRSQKKIQTNFDFKIFGMIDADVEYHDEHILKMIMHLQKPEINIISGAYPGKKHKNVIHAGVWDKCIGDARPFDSNLSGLHECRWTGGGFLFFTSEVLKSMRYPYFRKHYYEYKDSADEATEDFGFCIKAHNAGHKIYVDCDCRLEHHVLKIKPNIIGGQVMSKGLRYKIVFSSDKVSADGTELNEAKEKAIKEFSDKLLLTQQREPTEREVKIIKENIISKKEGEINLMKNLLTIKIKESKEIDDTAIAIDLNDELKNLSKEDWIVSKPDFDFLMSAYNKIDKSGAFFNYGSLIKQLQHPNKCEEEKEKENVS